MEKNHVLTGKKLVESDTYFKTFICAALIVFLLREEDTADAPPLAICEFFSFLSAEEYPTLLLVLFPLLLDVENGILENDVTDAFVVAISATRSKLMIFLDLIFYTIIF